MPTSMQKKLTKLFQMADGQHGYFTAKQATQCGFLPTNFTYHVKAGNWLHEGTGIYRLRNFPSSRESQMALYSLWSRNRDDEVQGVYSFETALTIHELSDVNPSKLHMTVPKNFRKSAEIPKVLKLHFDNLAESDIQTVNGIRVTTPMRTLIDSFNGETSKEFVEQAVVSAHLRGIITKTEIKSSDASSEMKEQFLKWIEWSEKHQSRKAGA